MNKSIREQVKKHALSEAPNEACGLIYADFISGESEVVPCENIHRDKVRKFKIDPREYTRRYRATRFFTIYHSHNDTFLREKYNRFSSSDKELSEELELPMLLYVNPNDTWHYYEPENYRPAPFFGRPFIRGIWQCHLLNRDYYRVKNNIHIKWSFASEENYNFLDFEENCPKELFADIPLEKIQKGDTILFKIGGTKTPNHCGLYWGNNRILEHLAGQRSRVTEINDRVLKRIYKVIRHRSLMDE